MADRALISNDCWGAGYYQERNLPYNTPTVGLWIAPDDYLHLLENFRRLITAPLAFPDSLKGLKPHPVGLLGGEVEIYFLHYKTQAEAAEKWARRVARLPPSDADLRVKVTDTYGFSRRHLERFARLPFAKLAIVTRGRFDTAGRPWMLEVAPATPEDALVLWGHTQRAKAVDLDRWMTA